MTFHDAKIQRVEPAALPDGTVPIEKPLAMPMQAFGRRFGDANAPGFEPCRETVRWRILTFLPAILTTALLGWTFFDWFEEGGLNGFEMVLIATVCATFFWIALSVSAATLGLFSPSRKKPDAKEPAEPIDVALLFPVYNENAASVFGNIRAMRDGLARFGSGHRFSIFVLSDTRPEDLAATERYAYELLSDTIYPTRTVPVYYRRREQNTGRKTGNIMDWITRWGGGYEGMIVLDADSLMSPKAVAALADELSRDPSTGLIQTVPRLYLARSVFARLQQFSNNIYGRLLATGLDKWSGTEGNYWGHNAIIRTRAFAASAGLPDLSGPSPYGGIIKSHDFVEAALLRRAGWSVRMVPDVSESYEELPSSLIDYVLRDRRWCQGNLQHLRLLFSRGLHGASRFHMFQGAMSYIASLGWFGLLILWVLMGRSESETVVRYFSDVNPLFPQWPEVDFVSKALVLTFVFGMLLAPKIAGLVAHALRDPSLKSVGGPKTFILSGLFEIAASFVLAPIMMVQQVVAVLRTFCGFDTGWAPQNRSGSEYGLITLLRFHWLETTLGVLITTGIGLGIVSLWLVPIALSLVLAVPISWATSKQQQTFGLSASLLATPQEISPPPIVKVALQERASFARALGLAHDGLPALPRPAEDDRSKISTAVVPRGGRAQTV